jgi:hypothetical protein
MIDASFSEAPLNARFTTVFNFCHASPPYVGASSDALLGVLELLVVKRLSITSGLKGCTPVALKELKMFFTVKLLAQAS